MDLTKQEFEKWLDELYREKVINILGPYYNVFAQYDKLQRTQKFINLPEEGREDLYKVYCNLFPDFDKKFGQVQEVLREKQKILGDSEKFDQTYMKFVGLTFSNNPKEVAKGSLGTQQ